MPDARAVARQVAGGKFWQAAGSIRRKPRIDFDRENDELRAIAVRDYVRALTGAEMPDYGRIHCPLPDHDDHSRDFSVVPKDPTGWQCFGCGRGGTIYDFAAYLWGMGTRGRAFHELHERLLEVLGRD